MSHCVQARRPALPVGEDQAAASRGLPPRRGRGWFVATRTLMRLMMRRGGHPTDTSHDYDYTDWGAVERFGREFAALVGQTSP